MATDIDFFEGAETAASPDAPATTAEKTTARTAQTPAANAPAKTKSAKWQDKIGLPHFLAVGALVVVVWAVWPMLGFGSAQPVPMGAPLPISPAAVSGVSPQQAQSAPEPAMRQQTALVDERKEPAQGEQETVEFKASLAQQQEQLRALLATQQEMKANLDDLIVQERNWRELVLKRLDDRAETSKPAKPAAAPSIRKSTAAKPESSVPGMRLNTVYPGQAWIDAPQGKTYIVQVGDVVEGARVLSIDERARVVQTTRGPIR